MTEQRTEGRSTGTGAEVRAKDPAEPPAPKVIRGADFTRASTEYFEREFDSGIISSSHAGLLLLRLATLLQNDAESRVHRPQGLRWTGFSALFALTLFERLEARSLARVIGVSRQAISLVLNVLERDGFIVRTPGKDRRTMVIELTDDGRRIADVTVKGQVALSEEWFECLSEEERTLFVDMIRRVLEARASRVRGDRGEDTGG